MRRYSINLIFVLFGILMASGPADARPAKPGITVITQPDGTTFTTILKGDEWFRIHTTRDGKAVIKDPDGWWSYAVYDNAGLKTSTGYHVGKDTPQAVLSQSMVINTGAMRINAARKREVLNRMMTREADARKMTKAAASEVRRGLVILAEYKDVSYTYTPEDFRNMMNQKGFNTTGSAKDYFDDQFKGMYEFSFDVSPIVTLSREREWYGGNDLEDSDRRPAEMVQEACRLAHEAGVDFSLYDMDNDGEVDNIHVFFAGGDEAEGDGDDRIWAHQWYITSGAGLPELKLDGKVIDRYSCSSELSRSVYGSKVTYDIAGIGAFCHEYSHTLGLPDFYDTDYDENGLCAGMWSVTSIMDGGSYNNNSCTPPYYNALERELLGITQPIMIQEGESYSMGPVHEEGVCYRMDTDRKGEYYLFECRAAEGWDRYIGGEGMLVYHVDRTNTTLWEYNEVNTRLSHQCADLIEADGRSNDLSSYSYISDISGLFFPYKTVTTLSATSSPALKYWSGAKCPITIKNIARSGKTVSFSAVGKNTVTPPKATDVKFASFTDAVLINFSSSTEYKGNAKVRCYTDTWSNTVEVAPYETGKYSVTISGLKPNSTPYKADIWFENEGLKGASVTINFMTKTLPDIGWPYIYLNYAKRNSDDSFVKGERFPLRVNNASDAAEITWVFNKKIITPADGYFTVTESGTLKAVIVYEDGSSYVIIKEITAK